MMSGSYGLISVGRGVKRDAMQGMEKVAQQEQERELRNDQLKQAEKQQKSTNVGAGASIGMMAAKGTAVGGPWGAVIGALAGLAASELF
ncbi:hypothetical protein [uncultured Microbulbifer sp.]|uniref:hypothetical protein n=1 Tax=uncultured Microbulbifer sp. TaxID=348147 RepID=UPI00260F0500|nr:hypothetical protein [uncultured Microbulbifer sp.]